MCLAFCGVSDVNWWQIGGSVFAIAISIVALYFSQRNWRESNRPIVSAFCVEDHMGQQASTFNLVLANTGNRPAVNVRLLAASDDIAKLLKPDATEQFKKSIADVFAAESIVPLLLNDEKLSTSFGAVLDHGLQKPWLLYGASIQIKVEYSDLRGKPYRSTQPLRVYAREGFGGGTWGDALAPPTKDAG